MLTDSIIAFVLIGTCLVLHTIGLVLLGIPLINRRQAIEQRAGTINSVLLLIAVFAALMLLHILETCVWAALKAGASSATWRAMSNRSHN